VLVVRPLIHLSLNPLCSNDFLRIFAPERIGGTQGGWRGENRPLFVQKVFLRIFAPERREGDVEEIDARSKKFSRIFPP
jgi:hypothetical protein